MLYIDGISLNKIKVELENELLTKKIGKISQDTELSVSLIFGKTSLVLSCNSSLPILYLSQSKTDSLNENFNFSLALKKYLLSAQLMKIEQIGMDRILCFYFSKMNELGETHLYKVYFELMGKHSNLIITDSKGKILDLLKKFSIEENNLRVLLPGADYVQPVIDKKISPFNISFENFTALAMENKIENSNNISYFKFLEGVGKQLSDYLNNFKNNVNNNSINNSINNSDKTSENPQNFSYVFEKLKGIMQSPIQCKCYFSKDKIIFATVLEGLTPHNFQSEKTFETFSEMFLFYIENTNLSSAMDNALGVIKSTLKKRIKKVENILKNIEKDNLEKADYLSFKEMADILSANIFSIKKHLESVELYDFYNDKMIKIELDPRATTQKNIDNYYKKYNKLKRGLESNKTRVITVQNELDYLTSTLDFAENSSDMDNLKSIIRELREQKYLKEENKKRVKNRKEVAKSNFGVLEQSDNFSIIYGRNNSENDFITFKVADKDNLWFHVKDVPGTHVILKCTKNLVTEDLILKAAKCAINFSKIVSGNRGTVEYTERRFVTKPNGARPGFVIYTNQKELLLEKE